jgi:hypothetical protein
LILLFLYFSKERLGHQDSVQIHRVEETQLKDDLASAFNLSTVSLHGVKAEKAALLKFVMQMCKRVVTLFERPDRPLDTRLVLRYATKWHLFGLLNLIVAG